MTTADDGPVETVNDAAALTELLGHVADLAAKSLTDVHGAGVALLASDTSDHVVAVAADEVGVAELEAIQSTQVVEGPCLLALQQRAPVASGQVAADDRWPRFGPIAAARGVHSVIAVPLLTDDVAVGTLACWSRAENAFSEADQRTAGTLAAWAGISVTNARILARAQTQTQQLQAALTSRATIDQAIGILRSRTGGTADEAFLSLRDISQRENVKLAIIAERLVEEAVRRARARHAHG